MVILDFFKKLRSHLFNKEAIDPNSFKVNVGEWDENSMSNSGEGIFNQTTNLNLPPLSERAELVKKRIEDFDNSLINLLD